MAKKSPKIIDKFNIYTRNIYLAEPQKNKKNIFYTIVIDETIEVREELLHFLHNLDWENSPYPTSCFIQIFHILESLIVMINDKYNHNNYLHTCKSRLYYVHHSLEPLPGDPNKTTFQQ